MEIDSPTLHTLAAQHGTPLFVYSSDYLKQRAKLLCNLQLPYGYTPRYAVKANNHPQIIRLFNDRGLAFDASSSYEVAELIHQGVDGTKISLSSQQPAHNLPELLDKAVHSHLTSSNGAFCGCGSKGKFCRPQG